MAGVLVFPSPNRIRVEGDIKGLPGGRYWWNRDEAQLQLTCETADGEQRTFTAWRHEDKVVDQNGRVVGRVLADDTIFIDAAAVSPDLVKSDEPRLCPAPGPEKPGGERSVRGFCKAGGQPSSIHNADWNRISARQSSGRRKADLLR